MNGLVKLCRDYLAKKVNDDEFVVRFSIYLHKLPRSKKEEIVYSILNNIGGDGEG